MAKGSLPTAQEAAQNWARGLQTGQEKMRASVNRTNVNPMERAASDEAIRKYANSTARAANSGYLAKRLRDTPVDAWKRGMLTKGISRAVEGANAALQKMAQALGPVLAQQAAIKAEIDAMPTETFSQRMAKANRQAELMHAWGEQRRGLASTM